MIDCPASELSIGICLIDKEIEKSIRQNEKELANGQRTATGNLVIFVI